MPLWWGRAAARWFAVLYDGDRDYLVAAPTATELGQLLHAAGPCAGRLQQAPAGLPGAGGMTAGLWSPPAPVRRPTPSWPFSSVPKTEHAPARRPVRGRHEADRRPGPLRRLLDAVTWTEPW
ncbi:hypothetical protein Acsp04_23260 [Actinomadura sp. NBRC 104425]|uniref:hypothetical protein n=1 Tax=Actinomadura sp. NBRC 104425 TaxID=3032204 RepID=UPI00249FD7C8|nr:hypothetical protein [Actinomadura sp. NBRC 104425]GLZ12091.1 hypothetical protein Acsp04_23260 [Actinomadura sp. NBRC 104425]